MKYLQNYLSQEEIDNYKKGKTRLQALRYMQKSLQKTNVNAASRVVDVANSSFRHPPFKLEKLNKEIVMKKMIFTQLLLFVSLFVFAQKTNKPSFPWSL